MPSLSVLSTQSYLYTVTISLSVEQDAIVPSYRVPDLQPGDVESWLGEVVLSPEVGSESSDGGHQEDPTELHPDPALQPGLPVFVT